MSLSGRMIKCSCGGTAFVEPQKARYFDGYHTTGEVFGFVSKCKKCNKRTLLAKTVKEAKDYWNRGIYL